MTRSRRRQERGNSAQLITIYWRDIPAQVTARAGRSRASAKLDDRFQTAIDGAATRAGMTDHESYLAEWREQRTACSGNLEAEVDKRKAELESYFTPERLREYVRSGGRAP